MVMLQVYVLEEALDVHRRLAPPAVLDLHKRLEDLFSHMKQGIKDTVGGSTSYK